MAQSPDYQSSPSPISSTHAHLPHSPPSVETLVEYLVSAKKSLGSFNLVHRATTILLETRTSLESTTALLAKTCYLRKSLAAQVKILRRVQFELEAAAQAIQHDFEAVIRELDDTDSRLHQYIQLLKDTQIEQAFNPTSSSGPGLFPHAPKETLHDFVDDKGIDTIKNAMKIAIDNAQAAHHDINQSIHTLEEDLQSVSQVLHNRIDASGTESELQAPTISRTLEILETHAREMAQGLTSLARHFDQCVKALKHTEGGGEAVLQTMSDEDSLRGAMSQGLDDQMRDSTNPITEEERLELLQVVESDAAQVDEVVLELQDRNADMESHLERVSLWRERQESAYGDVITAFKLLDKIGSRLQSYVADTARHSSRWNQERAQIEDGINGMEQLCDHYANFLHAYDGLIVEVARRRAVRKHMERVVAEARERLDVLYEQDAKLRGDFRETQGEFLPSDIWAGINHLPARYSIDRLDDNDMGVGAAGAAESIPDLPRKTVEEALKRLKASGR
ncbi:hypothetical protein PV10_06512 [Exophiala mesophila]|uniref:Autophagy-related protein 17 n=1 Tax=Exophiala mesophila TaxID=212818 RepID=A0A0D1ZBI4_EXOME|nr:uncharacterized protein PV10_06512 [Exophiala mesophila]KIV92037.1 hypothetical protein PV10_06512 [Exophiala mesophila]